MSEFWRRRRPSWLSYLARRSWGAALIGLAPVAIGIALIAADPPFIRSLRGIVFDHYLWLDRRPYDPAAPVRVIDIDDASLARIGQWPWPRTRMAELVEALGQRGAAAIAIDILMAEPDRSSPESIIQLLPDSKERTALQALISKDGRSNDDLFAATIAKYPVAMAVVLSPGNHAEANVRSRLTPSPVTLKDGVGFVENGDLARGLLPFFKDIVPPLPNLQKAAAGLGSINFLPDQDLIIRRVPTFLMAGDKVVPSLPMEALRLALRATTFTAKASNSNGQEGFGQQTGIVAIRIGNDPNELIVDTEADGAVRIRYAGSQPERHISAWRVLSGAVSRDEIEGRIVFIGSSAAALGDIRATPLQPVVPGVDVHAEFVEHVLSGRQIARPDYANGVEALLVILAGLVAAILSATLHPAAGALWSAGFGALIAAGSWFLFTRQGMLIDPVMPIVTLISSYGLATIVAYRQSEADKSRIRDAFGRYVSPAVVEALAADPSRLSLGGETRELTVIFADVRNFTKRSEQLPAEDVVRFLNAIHTPLTDIVMRRRGTIDKYIGDGLMAFWNAPLDDPDHTRHALLATLEMIAALPAIETNVASASANALVEGEPLKLGIGINTGSACVGNLGSTLRFDYSVVGDTVNSAARIEPLSKAYGVAIVVSQAVVEAAPDFAYVPIEPVTLRGRSATSMVYALHGGPDVARSDAFRRFFERHEAARWAVESQAQTAENLIAVAEADPLGQAYAAIYQAYRARLVPGEAISPAA